MSNDSKAKKVITLTELDEVAKGELVELSGWKDGTTIWVRLKYLDMSRELLEVGQQGLSNPLKEEAVAVFEGKKKTPSAELTKQVEKIGKKVSGDAEDMNKKLDMVARKALLEPTYEEITSRVPLTSDQKLEIWAWVMGGVAALKSFRSQSGSDGGSGDNSKEFLSKAK